MKTNVINTASENVTSFVINEDMLNEKKALKYINKPTMVAAVEAICAEIKSMNKMFAPPTYTESNSKKELIDAYSRFHIIYGDLKDAAYEAKLRAEEKAEIEAARQAKEIEKLAAPASKEDKSNLSAAEKLTKANKKMEKALKEEAKAEKKAKADKAPKADNKTSTEGEKKTARIGDAQARLDAYTTELAEKETQVAAAEEFAKLSKEDQKAIRHRIASLKRKIERANKALGTK